MQSDTLEEQLRQALRYDPVTGDLWWRESGRGRQMAHPAGCKTKGYTRVNFYGHFLFAHRIAWLLHYGDWPKFQIDHINGKRSDNRIANLRDVEPHVNSQNQRNAQKNNKTGLLGVSRKGNRYRAHITLGGKRVMVGSHKTPEEAHSAYVNAKRKWHKGGTL